MSFPKGQNIGGTGAQATSGMAWLDDDPVEDALIDFMEEIKTIRTKNQALLNKNHPNKWVRKWCAKLIKGEGDES